MTIKEFSRLCGCNPQTLRYYDHEDLLHPAKVDSWTGYRYYDEEQALTFVKIKTLQTAGFAITEIKALLAADPDTIYDAFAQKIREQEDRLEKIKEIQRSYQSEMKQMEEKVRKIREAVTEAMQAYDPTEEFGINKETYQRIVDQVIDYFEKPALELGQEIDYLISEGEEVPEEEKYLEILNNPDYEVVLEKHGWATVKEYFDDFEIADDGVEYVLLFTVNRDKADETAFANTVLGLVIGRNVGESKNSQKLGCQVMNSKDGENHFWLLREKR